MTNENNIHIPHPKKIPECLFIIGLFILLYNPPIFRFNTMHIVGCISLFYVLMCKYDRMRLSKEEAYVFFGFLAIAVYLLFFAVLVNSRSIAQASYPVYFIVDILPFGSAINCYLKKTKNNIEWCVDILLFAGLIQSIVAIIAFISSPVQQYFVDKLIQYGYSKQYSLLSEYRLYGFSDSLTCATPVLQSILSIVSLSMASNGVRYFFASIVMFFSAIINARISIVILIIGIIVFILFFNVESRKKAKYIIIMMLSIILFVFFVLPIIKEISPLTYEWITKGFEELKLFGMGNREFEKYTYFAYLQDDARIVFPDGLFSKLFGVGYTILSSKNPSGYQSDIGYINDIWLGGIVYSIIIYILFGKLIMALCKTKQIHVKTIGMISLIAIPFVNIKGIAFSMNAFMNMLVIIFIQTNRIKEEIFDEKKTCYSNNCST